MDESSLINKITAPKEDYVNHEAKISDFIDMLKAGS